MPKTFGYLNFSLYLCIIKIKQQQLNILYNMENMKQNITDNYIKAFISVAEILEPQVKFNDVNDNWYKTERGVEREVSVSGRLGNELIMVSTELDAKKGLQIVSEHYNMQTMKLLSKKNVCYFSFNWTALTNLKGEIF